MPWRSVLARPMMPNTNSIPSVACALFACELTGALACLQCLDRYQSGLETKSMPRHCVMVLVTLE